MTQLILSVLGSSFVTTAVLAAVAWLARNWLLTRLKASIEHEFNQKIERVRSELRRSEDELRDVRTTALQALTAKETAREARRTEGIEAVWGATLELKQQLYGLAASLEILNYDAMSDRIGEAKLQQYFQISFASADNSKLNSPKMLQAEAARPWVSPLIWALFKAYWAAIGYGCAVGTIFKLGEDPRRFTSPDKIEEFLSVALPDDINSFRPFRPALIAPALNLIEQRLLSAIREEVTGVTPSISTVRQAQSIAAAAAKLSSAITDQEDSPIPRPPVP